MGGTKGLTGDVQDDSARLANDRGARGHVPAVDAHVVVSVSRPARHQAHVDGGAAGTTDAGGGTQNDTLISICVHAGER